MGHVGVPVVRHGVLVPQPLVDPEVVGPVHLVPRPEKLGHTRRHRRQELAVVEHRGRRRLEPRHGLRVRRFGLLARLLLPLLWMHSIAKLFQCFQF